MIKISFPDGSSKTYEKPVRAVEVVEQVSPRLLKEAIVLRWNGHLKDVHSLLEEDGKIEVLTPKDPEALEVLRHSCSHLMAYAVRELYPKAKMTLGPVVEDGFYYDFDDLEVGEEDFDAIEKKMTEIAQKALEYRRVDISRDEALSLFGDNPYKVELISAIAEGEGLSYYTLGEEFKDLCRGPHIPHSAFLRHFKLLRTSGAYWRGDANNKMLTRIYGTCFFKKEELEAYLKRLEEAKKRDNRKIGKEQRLFFFHEYSPGSAFLLKRGTAIYGALLRYLQEQYLLRDYEEVITPNLFYKELWECSGHWEHYAQSMFRLDMHGREGGVKPMNCPAHMLIYKNTTHSYRDLPIRIADFGSLHRDEVRGALGGMTRVVKFHQDDAHIFCREDQVSSEIEGILDFLDAIYKETFDFQYEVTLSTRPKDFMGEISLWNEAEEGLKKALEQRGLPYQIEEGEGAFYGPKIDFKIRDAIGRGWQCSTIQLDFQLPRRFDIVYEGSDGQKHYCVVVHRALLGSLERFMGILIEHYAGKFPFWLSPEQVRIVTINDKVHEYGKDLRKSLLSAGIRTSLDDRGESLSRKIREAQLDKVFFVVTVGEQEVSEGSVSVRTLEGETKQGISKGDFLTLCKTSNERRVKTIHIG